jgi:hypothetical protein
VGQGGQYKEGAIGPGQQAPTCGWTQPAGVSSLQCAQCVLVGAGFEQERGGEFGRRVFRGGHSLWERVVKLNPAGWCGCS